MAEWYYVKNDRQCGPVSQETLVQMAAAGQIAGDDLVWTDAMKDWAPASEVPGLIAPAAAARGTVRPRKAASGGWDSLSDGTKVGIMVMAVGGLIVLLIGIVIAMSSEEPPPKPKPKPAVVKTEAEKGGGGKSRLRVIPFDPKYLETEKDKELFEEGRKHGEHFA